MAEQQNLQDNETTTQPANVCLESPDEQRVPSQEEMIRNFDIRKEAFGDKIPQDVQNLIDDNNRMQKLYYDHARDVNIIITGLTGSGKSALSNVLRGLKPDEKGAAKEGDQDESLGRGCTETVEGKTSSLIHVETFGFRIWDTPGLFDGSKLQKQYLEEIRVAWKECNLVIFCIRAEPRFVLGPDNRNVQAMIALTKHIGKSFWTKAIIVITYANIVEMTSPKWSRMSNEDQIKYFKTVMQRYEKEIKENMTEYVKIDQKVLENIQIIPAGHQDISESLPDRQYWLTPLWFGCLHAIPDEEGKIALTYHSKKRFGYDIPLSDDFIPRELIELQQKYKKIGGILGISGILAGPTVIATIILGYYYGKQYGVKEYAIVLDKRRRSQSSNPN